MSTRPERSWLWPAGPGPAPMAGHATPRHFDQCGACSVSRRADTSSADSFGDVIGRWRGRGGIAPPALGWLADRVEPWLAAIVDMMALELSGMVNRVHARPWRTHGSTRCVASSARFERGLPPRRHGEAPPNAWRRGPCR